MALHTFEKVWVRYRSYDRRTLGHQHLCLYNEIRCQGHRSYLFAQHYEVDWKWRSQKIYARLFQGRGGEAIMRLSQRPGGCGIDHTLVFWNHIEHCFVFNRTFEGSKDKSTIQALIHTEACRSKYSPVEVCVTCSRTIVGNTSRWVMSAVRIAVLFYLPLALNGATLKDLKEAVNTRERIWTVYRSYYPSARGHNQTCIYSEMRMTKRGYYIADVHYEVDGVWKSERYYARLISSKHEPVMRVSPEIAQRGFDYTLYFWTPKEHCAVFLLVLAGKVHCEVRTWQDHVRATAPFCRKAYESRCGRDATSGARIDGAERAHGNVCCRAGAPGAS
ncbi:uncharacterized protein [Dermacentor albipictus]|uniref:uncharacterized protein isoform X2 n=1 Tax=Dermacentor albipictus TaxID=60249 RepID=UPI0038FCBCAD